MAVSLSFSLVLPLKTERSAYFLLMSVWELSFLGIDSDLEINLTTKSIWSSITAGRRRNVFVWTERVFLEEIIRFEHEC